MVLFQHRVATAHGSARRCGVRQPIGRDADRRLPEDVAEDREARWASSRHHATRDAPQLCQSCHRSQPSEPTIASLLGHKTHSITSRYMHSADAVANATMKLMASDQAQPQLRDQHRDGSVVRDGITYKEVFS